MMKYESNNIVRSLSSTKTLTVLILHKCVQGTFVQTIIVMSIKIKV